MDGVLPLFNAILEPIISHVDGLASLLFEGAIEDALAYLIVGDDGGCRLWVAEEFQSYSDWAAFLATLIGCSHFCFRGRGNNRFNDVSDDMQVTIQRRIVLWFGGVGMVAEVEVVGSSGF